jgi:hypothetical protein
MSDYVNQLQAKLEAARKRVKQGREAKALKDSAPTLYEIIDGEISLAVNKMTQNLPLERDEYLSLHGQVVGIRRIRDLLNSKEAEEVQAGQEIEAIEDNLKNMKTNGKK